MTCQGYTDNCCVSYDFFIFFFLVSGGGNIEEVF